MKYTKRVRVTVPTAAGWGVLLVVVALLTAVGLTGIYPFLAVQETVDGEVLVVEGWIAKSQASEAIDILRAGKYRLLATTGGMVPEGTYLQKLYPDAGSYAEVTARMIRDLGLGEDSLLVAPAPGSDRHRTYIAALAFRDSLASYDTIRRVDVLTDGPHARRTRLLFSLALGDSYSVGVIGTEPRGYEASTWYQSSEGGTRVLKELIAYVYAKLLFWP